MQYTRNTKINVNAMQFRFSMLSPSSLPLFFFLFGVLPLHPLEEFSKYSTAYELEQNSCECI